VTNTELTVQQQIQKALDLITELNNNRRRWVMSIPARPDYDPDIVIGTALHNALATIQEQAARIAQLEHELAELRPSPLPPADIELTESEVALLRALAEGREIYTEHRESGWQDKAGITVYSVAVIASLAGAGYVRVVRNGKSLISGSHLIITPAGLSALHKAQAGA
jgi:hypothetical protein